MIAKPLTDDGIDDVALSVATHVETLLNRELTEEEFGELDYLVFTLLEKYSTGERNYN